MLSDELKKLKRDERHLTNTETRYWCDQYRLLAERAVAEAAVKDAEREFWGLYDPVTNEAFKVDGHSALTQEVTDRCIPLYSRQQASAAVPDEGKLWSFLRNVLSQGAAIHQDKHDHYERYSARLDAAAAERATELLALLAASQPEVK